MATWEEMSDVAYKIVEIWPRALLREKGRFSKEEVANGGAAWSSTFYQTQYIFHAGYQAFANEVYSGFTPFFAPEPAVLKAAAESLTPGAKRLGELKSRIIQGATTAGNWDGQLARQLSEGYFPHLGAVADLHDGVLTSLQENMRSAAALYESTRDSALRLGRSVYASLESVVNTGGPSGIDTFFLDVKAGKDGLEKAISAAQDIPIAGKYLGTLGDGVGVTGWFIDLAARPVQRKQKKVKPVTCQGVLGTMRDAWRALRQGNEQAENAIIAALNKTGGQLGDPRRSVAAPVEWSSMPTADLREQLRPKGSDVPPDATPLPKPDPQKNYGSKQNL